MNLLNVIVRITFSSILKIWDVEVRISRSVSESPLEFEITRVDCISFDSFSGQRTLWTVCTEVRSGTEAVSSAPSLPVCGKMIFYIWYVKEHTHSHLKNNPHHVPFRPADQPYTYANNEDHHEPSHQDLHCLPLCFNFWLASLFAILDMSELNDRNMRSCRKCRTPPQFDW